MVKYMSRIYEDVIKEINSRLELVDIVSETVQLTRKGNRYWGLCPFHQEKTASFSVTPERNMFYCFGCHAGGDMISYIMKRENMEFREAVEYLANRAGVTVQQETPAVRRKRDRAMGVLAANKAAAQFYNQLLLSAKGKKALKYLQERHLSPAIVEKFSLGYAPDSWNTIEDYLFKKAFSQEQVKSTGLIKRSDHQQNRYYDLFRDRIIFPIHDQRGEVVGFGGRVLDGSLPKYLNTPETELFSKRKNLYGLYQARQAMRNLNQALVVEGYMDCLKLHQAGIENTVATLGTALTQDQARLLRRFVEEVVLLFDGDDAGQREALRAIEVLHAEGLKIWVVSLPGGKDPDEYLDLYGKEEFLQYIQNSKVDYIEFKLNRYINSEVELNLEKRIRIISAVQKDIASLESELAKDYYTRMLSRRLQIEENLVRRELNKNGTGSLRLNKSGIFRDNTRYGKSSLEERLLVSMLKNPLIFEEIQRTVGLNIFRSIEYRQLLQSYAHLASQKNHSWEDLGSIARQKGFESAYARIMFLMEEEEELKLIEVQGIIRRIQMRRKQLRWHKLQERLHQMSEDADFDQLLRFILDVDSFINSTHKGVTS
jgi:DNA primase